MNANSNGIQDVRPPRYECTFDLNHQVSHVCRVLGWQRHLDRVGWISLGLFRGELSHRRPIVAAHTNLTEIDEAFKLYWRVGVQSSQMVRGKKVWTAF
jgi:hypothetical protein